MSDNLNRPINVAVIGAGTVGKGTMWTLSHNAKIIETRAMPIRIKWLAEKNTAHGQAVLEELGLNDTQLTDDWHNVINDPETDIVVELIGGTGLAYEIHKAVLGAGKTSVTANKDLIATKGGELMAHAEANHTDLFFEAAVGGGIPIIQTMKESLAANRFLEIVGIVNGTTNYILSKMAETGADFDEMLAEAQRLGYAEADPTSDVEGYDAARKMAILASIAFNSRVTFPEVYSEGITKITSWDILYAHQFGYTIKMLGIARSDGNSMEVRVQPTMIKSTHPLAAVNDSYNAIFVKGDALENAMFFGRGAGSLPTGSAVAGDVITAARNITHNCKSRWGCTCHLCLPLIPIEETISKYYLRIGVNDKAGVFAALAAALSDANVSMDAVAQKRTTEDGGAEIVIITHPAKHKDIIAARSIIAQLDCVREVGEYIRVEDTI